MQLKSIIKRWIPGYRSTAWDLPSWRAVSGINPSGESCDPRGLSAVYSAVTLLSGLMASLPHRIVKDSGSGLHVISGSDAAQALSELDFTHREQLYMDLLLGGNAFILKHDRNGRLHNLEVLDASKIILMVDDDGSHFYDHMPDAFTRREQVTYPASRIIHFRYRTGGGYGPHPLLGVSPLSACVESFGLVESISVGTRSYYRNVSVPSGVLETEMKMGADEVDILRGRWKQHTAGKDAGGTPILTHGLQWKQAGGSRSAIDNSLADIQRVSVLEIARAFGVPSQLLNETSSLNYSTSVELHRSFASMTLSPMAKRLSDTYTHALVNREKRLQGFRADVDASALMVGSGEDKASYYKTLIDAGIMSPDEARAKFNMAPGAPNQVDPQQNSKDILRLIQGGRS